MIYMNERCKSILQMLLNQNSYLQPAQIAEILKVSKRSIYYDIYRINDWLSSYKISELETVRGKGILLSDLQKAAIEEALQDSSQEETYIYSPMERIPIIYCSILSKEKPIYIEQLMEYCDVSRNTVFNDLKVMETQLLNYNLKLRYVAKTGYYIAGDENKIRAVFISYFNKLQVLYKRGNLKFFSREKIKVTLDTLKKIEKTLIATEESWNKVPQTSEASTRVLAADKTLYRISYLESECDFLNRLKSKLSAFERLRIKSDDVTRKKIEASYERICKQRDAIATQASIKKAAPPLFASLM